MMGAKFKKSLVGGLFFGLAAMLIVTSPALAVDTYWTGLTGNWIDSGKWTNGVPDSEDDNVFIDFWIIQ